MGYLLLEFFLVFNVLMFIGGMLLARSAGSLLLPLIGLLLGLIYSGYMIYDGLMSLLLFLIYAGGILVMFIYAVIISSNYIFQGVGIFVGGLSVLCCLIVSFIFVNISSWSISWGPKGPLSMDFFMVDVMGVMLLLIFLFLYSLLSGGVSVLKNDATNT